MTLIYRNWWLLVKVFITLIWLIVHVMNSWFWQRLGYHNVMWQVLGWCQCVWCCIGAWQSTVTSNDWSHNRQLGSNSHHCNSAPLLSLTLTSEMPTTTSATEHWHKHILTVSLPGCVFTRRSLVLAASRSNLSDSRVFFSFCQVTKSPVSFTSRQQLHYHMHHAQITAS